MLSGFFTIQLFKQSILPLVEIPANPKSFEKDYKPVVYFVNCITKPIRCEYGCLRLNLYLV